MGFIEWHAPPPRLPPTLSLPLTHNLILLHGLIPSLRGEYSQGERETSPVSHCAPFAFSFALDGEPVLEQKFEAVAQGAHVRVHGALQLKGLGYDFDGPALELGVLAGLEAEVEVARTLGVDAESVHASFRVGFRVGRQPALWRRENALA